MGTLTVNPPVAWPMHLYDCCPISDGASWLTADGRGDSPRALPTTHLHSGVRTGERQRPARLPQSHLLRGQ